MKIFLRLMLAGVIVAFVWSVIYVCAYVIPTGGAGAWSFDLVVRESLPLWGLMSAGALVPVTWLSFASSARSSDRPLTFTFLVIVNAVCAIPVVVFYGLALQPAALSLFALLVLMGAFAMWLAIRGLTTSET